MELLTLSLDISDLSRSYLLTISCIMVTPIYHLNGQDREMFWRKTEAKWFAQGVTAGQQRCWEPHPGLAALSLVPYPLDHVTSLVKLL